MTLTFNLPTYEFFFTKNPNLFLCVGGGGGGGKDEGGWGGGVDGWSDVLAQTNLPLQLLRSLGLNDALIYKLCP